MRRFIVSFLILCVLPIAVFAVNIDADSSRIANRVGYAYEQISFSERDEIFDFIKTLDFQAYPPLKRLSDFYNEEKELTNDKLLYKGIALYQKGKVKKALDYFMHVYKDKKSTKLQKDFASWQIAHYKLFGLLDIYYNGYPSRMDRTNTIPGNYASDTYLGLGAPYLMLIADSKLSTYDPVSLLTSISKCPKSLLNNPMFTKEYLAAVLYEAFQKNGKIKNIPFAEGNPIFGFKPLRTEIGDVSYSDFVDSMVSSIISFFNLMDCMHIVAGYSRTIDEYYGIGLTANEMYLKAKHLNPDKVLLLTDYKKGIRNIDIDTDENCQVLLLRSAYYGHPDAIMELMPYIMETIQYGKNVNIGLNKKWEKRLEKDPKEATYDINWIMIESFRDVLKRLAETKYFRENTYVLEAMETYADNSLENMRLVALEEDRIEWEKKEARRKRRNQIWSNVAGMVLNGMSTCVNAYLYNHNVASNNAGNIQYKDYGGSIDKALSNPAFLDHEYQRLLQLSVNQVLWDEMQEYNQAREACQRMGKDLSLDEFRAMKGQAIMNLREQSIDIIAEQNAANREMRDFNRSQMNLGKENVARIKQQNAMKYGKSHSSVPSTSNSAISRPTKTSANSSSHNASATISSSTARTGDYGSNASYRYIQRKVNLHENPNQNSAVIFQNCEIYQKQSDYFVKIGEQYYKIQYCNKQHYNRTITVGSHPYYFNM